MLACLVGGAVMCIVGATFYLIPRPYVLLFVDREKIEVVAMTVPLLRIVAFSMPALALSMILTGALRGAGDTRIPFLFTVVGFLGVRIPGAYVATRVLDLDLQQAIQAAWLAMVLDVTIRCWLVCARFYQGGWKKIQV